MITYSFTTVDSVDERCSSRSTQELLQVDIVYITFLLENRADSFILIVPRLRAYSRLRHGLSRRCRRAVSRSWTSSG